MVEKLTHEPESMGGTMMISVRKGSVILAAVLLLVCVFSVSALADTDLTSGNGGEASTFYVESYGNASLVLAQVEGSCNYLNYAQSAAGTMGTSDAWGMYHIVVTAPGGNQYTQNWESMNNGSAYTLQLYNSGTYQIQMVPYSSSEMTAAWGINRFVRWNTYPFWWVDDTINCSIRTSGANTTTAVTVQQVDANTGTVLATRTESVYYGNNTIQAPSAPYGYRLASSNAVNVYVDSYGQPSTYNVTFYYAKEAQTQSPGSVSVNCYDDSGRLLKSYTETLVSSRPVIPRYIDGYYTTSNSVFVTYSNGSCAPYSLNFFYKKYPIRENITPVPVITPEPGYTAAPVITAVPVVTLPPSSGGGIYNNSGGQRSSDQAVLPWSWDTQFKPGVNSDYNENRYEKLGALSDNNYYTSFSWLIWEKDNKDATPELTAYFNGETISSIGIRNGCLQSSSEFGLFARFRTMKIDLYDSEGHMYSADISIPDGYSTDYRVYSLGGTYPNIVRADLWVTGFKSNREADLNHRNVVHVSGIEFYK